MNLVEKPIAPTRLKLGFEGVLSSDLANFRGAEIPGDLQSPESKHIMMFGSRIRDEVCLRRLGSARLAESSSKPRKN